jgi:hypothetical protein
MSSTPNEPSSREQPVNDAIAEFQKAVDRGESPDQQRVPARHADISCGAEIFFADQPEDDDLGRKSASDVDQPTVTFQKRDVPTQVPAPFNSW